MTNLFLIKGKKHVYGTYFKTICYKKSFSTEEEKEEAIQEAKVHLFDYSLTFGAVSLQVIKFPIMENDVEVFEFLEQRNK